ncbi:MAG TPA: hypothetical protein VK157_02550 [Phycisphaerales bacterium]|nr:hypothetical protein [Phycisphaerales bacterium]
MNDMHNNADNPMDLSSLATPQELLGVERSLHAAGLQTRAGATNERLDRVASATWAAASVRELEAPAPIVLARGNTSILTPLRMAAMLAIGAGVIASVLALRSTPNSMTQTLAQRSTTTQPETSVASGGAVADELAMFDSYLASADASRSGIDSFVEDASDLEDRFDALSSGQDWWSDTDGSATQGAS